MDIKEAECDVMEWIILACDEVPRRAYGNINERLCCIEVGEFIY
jgi:hypothetical protein